MKLILTRPQHDITTRYLFYWAEAIVGLAKTKGIEVFDLAKHKANRVELEGRVKKLQPELVFLNGHGGDDCVCGHNNEVLIAVGKNHTILGGKITYALSCDSGKKLGPAVVKEPKTAYIGYADEFVFVGDSNYTSKLLQDPKARPFMESSNQVMLSLLKGNSPAEACQRSKNKFREHYLKCLSSTADADSLQIAQFLWWDRQNQVCLENN